VTTKSWRALALGALIAGAPTAAAAQTTTGRPDRPWTGYELALSGASTVRAGRDARFRGVAYRVRGLSSLVPFSGRVRARLGWRIGDHPGSTWTAARVDADGRFEIALPIPLGAAEGEPRVEVEVGPEGDARVIELPVSVVPGVEAMLRTDRALYEPSETAHVWMLVRDVGSGRPLAGEQVELTVDGGDVLPLSRHAMVTNEAGVAHLELSIPAGSREGQISLHARIPGQASWDRVFRVGTRTWERLFARVTVNPEEVAPNAAATVSVEVTTASGAPVRDASLSLLVDGTQRYSGVTDATGHAVVPVRAPAYLVHQTGSVAIEVEITHPAHGSLRAFGRMRLAVPLALEIDLVPRQGGLIPEIDDVLFVRLRDGVGHPPAAATEVTVEGPAVRGGRATATTDVNGLAEIPMRVPLGAASAHRGEPETTVLVTVAGPLERLARMPVRVQRDAEVGLVADRAITEPGAPVEVRLTRRPSVERLPVLVELVDDRGEPLVVRLAPPRVSTVRFDLPPERLGLLSIRARAVHADESLEGAGSYARIIVRPADPDFVALEPERTRWTVSETARVRLRTGAGGPQRFAALLVRDLAAHGGEQPFERTFLDDAFDRAILDPRGEGADRLVRAALGAHVGEDPFGPIVSPLVDALGLESESIGRGNAEGRDVLRDPWPLARELERRGVAEPMRAVEARLVEALAEGSVDAITTGAGASRHFREDLFELDLPTLGGDPMTPAILEAADPSFRFETVARRVARARLVLLMSALAAYLDPGDDVPPAARMAAREPSSRWLPRMVERGLLDAHALDDPWGGRFALRPTRTPLVVLSAHATGLELVSPGPDGRLGTRDDVRDPFARAVPTATPYAVASGEDALMRRLAVLSPLARTLEAITESYRRISAEMTEEAIGDAVSAEVSEGTIGLGSLGMIGHGGGGGSGSGYGRGAGGMASRSSRSPQVRIGMASVSGLAAVVRERFPPTLLFLPSVDVDPSGTTELAIPLADAVTTYLVEVIVWREDGWISSASTRFEVDRDVVASAPIPSVAHVGDRLRLPLRVGNRTAEARSLRVRSMGDAALGIADSEPRTIEVGPADAAVVPLELSPSQVGEGHLTVAVTDPEGRALDALRLPMRVIAPSRRVLVERDALAEGETTIALDVPGVADPREGSITLSVGSALFPPDGGDNPWAMWAPSAGGVAPVDPESARVWLRERSATRLGFAVGAAWASDAAEPRGRPGAACERGGSAARRASARLRLARPRARHRDAAAPPGRDPPR
jgi:hypothetical protein